MVKCQFLKYCTLMAVLIVFQAQLIFPQNSKNSDFEYRNNLKINKRTNIVEAMFNIESKVYSGKPDAIAKQFLDENKTVLGIADINDLHLLETIESPGAKHVGFLQTHMGIPVFGSEMVVNVNKENRVTMVVNGNKRVKGVNATNATVTKDEAIKSAIQKLNVTDRILIDKPKAELYIYQDSLDQSYLAWKVNFTAKKPRGDWQIFIDATNGRILKIMDIGMYYGSGKGRVFRPDPISALQSTSLSNRDNTDYPEIQGAYVTVTLSNLNDPVNGIYTLQGLYARSEQIMSAIEPVQNTTSDFSYNRSQPGFEETNAYYTIDTYRQYIGGLGFNPQWNGNSYIRFNAHGFMDDNAFYSPSGLFLVFGGGCIDLAEDMSVIIHEYGHAIHDALMVGTGMGAELSDESAISEGTGDYLALSFRKTFSNFQPDIIFPWWANRTDNCWEGRLLHAEFTYPSDWSQSIGDDHIRGILWASTIMDIENVSSIGRDITTTLLLASFTYVSNSSSIKDHINAIFQADRDIYKGVHLLALAEVFNQRGFFSDDQVSGNISSYVTWSGSKYITGNVTINPGAYLNISPNTFIFFDNNASLIVYGSLSANGAIFDFVNKNGNNGIKVYSNATIYSSTIKNANTGIYIAPPATLYLSNSTITGCNNGISTDQGAIGVYSSTFTGNDKGIYDINTNNKKKSLIEHNIFSGNNIGIYLSASSPRINTNTFYRNSYGIYGTTNSSPYFGNVDESGDCDFIDNTVAMYVAYNSNPVLGTVDCINTGGNNRFLRSSLYHIMTDNNCIVEAESNYWNELKFSGTTIHFEPYYLIDANGYPLGTMSLGPTTLSPEEKLYNKEMKGADSVSANYVSWNSDVIDAAYDAKVDIGPQYNKQWPLKIKTSFLRNLVFLQKYDNALKLGKEIIREYPDSALSVYALDLLWQAGRTSSARLNDFEKFLEELTNNDEGKFLRGKSELMLALCDTSNINDALDKVIGKVKINKLIREEALIDKFSCLLTHYENRGKAASVLDEIDTQFPNSQASEIGHLLFEGKVGSSDGNMLLKSMVKEEKVSTASNSPETVKEYALLGNYPNPFNPETIISYALPEESNVELRIYNLMGKLVRTFLYNSQPSGYKNIRWNGKDENGDMVSSGIYIYRLQAVSNKNQGKMFVRSAKMMIMK
ncbi:MAG: FlgD immunoglobulin-like domain containing protein [Acidobacteriota bacterium]